MRSLKESIISSNNVGIYSRLKYLLHNAVTRRDLNVLDELWNKIGLGIDGCNWFHNSAWTYYAYDGQVIACVIKSDRNGHDIRIYKGFAETVELIKKLKSKDGIIIDESTDRYDYLVKFPGKISNI